MKNLLVAVLLSAMPLPTFAWDFPWDFPWVVKEDTYEKEKTRREDAEKKLKDSEDLVLVLGAIIGVLVLGILLRLLYSTVLFLAKRGRDSWKRK